MANMNDLRMEILYIKEGESGKKKKRNNNNTTYFKKKTKSKKNAGK